MQFLPLIAIPVIFYFLLIAPQRKQQKETADMIASLKNGDIVLTSGGIVGKIVEVKEKSFILRSAEKTLIEVTRTSVIGVEPNS